MAGDWVDLGHLGIGDMWVLETSGEKWVVVPWKV